MKAKFPGAIFALAPGGSIGEYRQSVVEVKAAVTSIVIPLEPRAILIREGQSLSLEHYDHITIHSNLMVHTQGDKGTINLLQGLTNYATLSFEAIHLVTVSASPPGVTNPYSPRAQKQYDGGSAIISFVPDTCYDKRTTHLIVDLWASKPSLTSPNLLPPTRRKARPALSRSGPADLGPIPSSWAFRRGDKPSCVFHLRFWFEEVDETNGAPFVVPGKYILSSE